MRRIMTETIIATYKNGCFRPLHPLNLPEDESVRIVILPFDSSPDYIQMLIRADIIRSFGIKRDPAPPDPLSDEERAEIARKLGDAPGKPLSVSILSERDS